MLSRLATVATIALVSILAVATPAPLADKRGGEPAKTVTVTATGPTQTGTGSCSTGPIQCCNSVESASSPGVATLLGLLGVVLEGVVANVGLTCSPISVIGAGGGSCNANAVCCENNSFGGLISIGCVPVIL